MIEVDSVGVAAVDDDEIFEVIAGKTDAEADAGNNPDPEHIGLPCPWPCFRQTPDEPTSLKCAPHTEHLPELEFCEL